MARFTICRNALRYMLSDNPAALNYSDASRRSLLHLGYLRDPSARLVSEGVRDRAAN
jgi:hypothetical protein